MDPTSRSAIGTYFIRLDNCKKRLELVVIFQNHNSFFDRGSPQVQDASGTIKIRLDKNNIFAETVSTREMWLSGRKRRFAKSVMGQTYPQVRILSSPLLLMPVVTANGTTGICVECLHFKVLF